MSTETDHRTYDPPEACTLCGETHTAERPARQETADAWKERMGLQRMAQGRMTDWSINHQ